VFQKTDDPVALAVDLINTWDELEPPAERLPDLATLSRFLQRRGYEAEAKRATNRDLRRIRSLRDALRESFAADDEGSAVVRLNRVLDRSRGRPQLERAEGAWRVRWVGDVVDVVASTAAMSLLEAIRDDGWERFGSCAGAPCCCVFVDRSKNRSRRFCSDLCADRVAQAAHRARRRAARPAQRRKSSR
jgi:predicted RNA-binding Zn ribbon-like protein